MAILAAEPLSSPVREENTRHGTPFAKWVCHRQWHIVGQASVWHYTYIYVIDFWSPTISIAKGECHAPGRYIRP